MNESNKGLTPTGTAVLLTACIGLIALPVLFWVISRASYMVTPSVRAVPPPAAYGIVDAKVSHKLKRVGKDVEVIVTLDNSKSTLPVDTWNVNLALGGIKPLSVPAPRPVGARSTQDVRLLVPSTEKGQMFLKLSVNYSYKGGGGMSTDIKMVDVP